MSIATPSSGFTTAGAGAKPSLASVSGSMGAVEALIDLGMDPKLALAQFGGLDTLDGSTPASDTAIAAAAQAGANARPAASAAAAAPITAVSTAASVSTSTPYDTQSATISLVNNLVQGYGCSTIYLVYASGGDWFFSNKYKFSAQSVSHALFPLRLKQVGWRLAWASGNTPYDWDPSSTRPIGSCITVTSSSSATYKGVDAGISIAAPICPNSFGPWGPITSTQSGGIWDGPEVDNDFEDAIGTQELHSPPTAPASHTSSYTLTWQCGTDC